MEKLNRRFIIIAAAIILSVVIGFGIAAIVKINDMSNQIDALNSRITQINFNNQSILSDLKSEIQNQLEEQNKNYFGVSKKIVSVDVSENTAEVEVRFSLKESPILGDVTVSYGMENTFEKVIATKITDGKFVALLDVELSKEYEVSYSMATTNVKTEKLLQFNVVESFKRRLKINSGFYFGKEPFLILDFNIGNSFSGNNKMKISTAIVEIYKDGALAVVINAKDYVLNSNVDYEEFGSKGIVLREITMEDFNSCNVQTVIKITDNYGLTYTFGDSVGNK